MQWGDIKIDDKDAKKKGAETKEETEPAKLV